MLDFKIIKLDLNQSYFFGEVEFRSDIYKVNIQNERRGKVLRLPFPIEVKSERLVVRASSSEGELFVEDYVVNPNDSESDFEIFWANDGHAHDMLYIDRENENDGGGHFSYSKNNGDYVIAILARCEIF